MFMFTDENVVFANELDDGWVIWSPFLSWRLWLEPAAGPFANIDNLDAGELVRERIVDEMVITVQERFAWDRLKAWLREHPAPPLAPILAQSRVLAVGWR